MLRPFLLSVGIRVVDRKAFLFLGSLAKGAGSQSGEFAELTAEVRTKAKFSSSVRCIHPRVMCSEEPVLRASGAKDVAD